MASKAEKITSAERLDQKPILVVKIGGNEGNDWKNVCEDAALMFQAGRRIVIVHGASGLTTDLCKEAGINPEYYTSLSGTISRRTGPKVLEIFMAACFQIRNNIIREISNYGIPAVGFPNGENTAPLLTGEQKRPRTIVNGRRVIFNNDFTAKITRVDETALKSLLDRGCLPVISPLVRGNNGNYLTTNADRAAAEIAIALRAQLVFLTNVPGVLRNLEDPLSTIGRLSPLSLSQMLPSVQGGMWHKLHASQIALQGSVDQIIISDSRSPGPITAALSGRGTVLVC